MSTPYNDDSSRDGSSLKINKRWVDTLSPRIISQEDFNKREKELIDVARNIVEGECLSTLTIDKLVAQSAYSKGTIYKHFISKEDLLMAMSNSCMRELQEFFARALMFDGNSRERMVAVMVSYVIWAKSAPSQLFAVLSAHSPAVAALSSEERVLLKTTSSAKLMSMFNDEIGNAIKAGDLVLPEGMFYEQVTFAMWSASWGAMALITSKGESKDLGPMMLERESFTNIRLILDGFGWKPLSGEWDYNDTIKRIVNTLFQAEIEKLEQNGTPFNFI